MSQCVAATDGTGTLYDELRKLFERDYEPTRVHAFFASLPNRLAALRGEATKSSKERLPRVPRRRGATPACRGQRGRYTSSFRSSASAVSSTVSSIVVPASC